MNEVIGLWASWTEVGDTAVDLGEGGYCSFKECFWIAFLVGYTGYIMNDLFSADAM